MTQPARKPWHRHLYVQVLVAIGVGILLGCLWPDIGKKLKPVSDAFISLVRMLIAPIIFCTVVHGIASMRDFRKLGRIGGKALLYFEVVSTAALLLGLVVVNLLKPGAGVHADPAALDAAIGKGYAAKASQTGWISFILNIIPRSFFDAFATGDLLQVLLVAVLAAVVMIQMKERAKPLLDGCALASRLFFGIMHLVVRLAPIAALAGIAFTVGSFGMSSLGNLAKLMGAFYATAILFVLVVLGGIAAAAGFSIIRFLGFIKDELLLVLGTSSSETALPGIVEKLRRLGCSESTVGLVVPTGYSFNLDGTNIYLTMAVGFLAQATDTPLDLKHQAGILLVAMISSKGASGVTGAGFITLAATLAAVPRIPIESLALIVGIDRFMSECRALTNLVGNGVATLVISRWEREITPEQIQRGLTSGGRGAAQAESGRTASEF